MNGATFALHITNLATNYICRLASATNYFIGTPQRSIVAYAEPKWLCKPTFQNVVLIVVKKCGLN